MKMIQSITDNIKKLNNTLNDGLLDSYKILDNKLLLNVLTIVLYNHNDLKKFKEACSPIGDNNEYQCHYFALVRVEKNNNATLNLVVPLIYYNYKQKVSGATVDFNMNDVTEVAKQIEETARLQAKRVKLLLKRVEPILDNVTSVEYKLTFYNNIHKHP